MAWGRLDDDFHDNPKVAELLEEPEGWAALGFWTATWSWANKHTRRPGKTPGRLPRASVMAFDRANAARFAGLLVKVGLWELTETGWQIHDFDRYLPSARKRAAQSENARKRWSKPSADATGIETDASGMSKDATAMPRFESLASHGQGKGSSFTEGDPLVKGGPGGSTARRLPDDFAVTPEMVAWAKANVPYVDGRLETQKFRDHWAAASGANARKRDWVAAWRNWMREADQRLGQRNGRVQQTLPVAPGEEHMMRR